jgi:hypothetical protein
MGAKWGGLIMTSWGGAALLAAVGVVYGAVDRGSGIGGAIIGGLVLTGIGLLLIRKGRQLWLTPTDLMLRAKRPPARPKKD